MADCIGSTTFINRQLSQALKELVQLCTTIFPFRVNLKRKLRGTLAMIQVLILVSDAICRLSLIVSDLSTRVVLGKQQPGFVKTNLQGDRHGKVTEKQGCEKDEAFLFLEKVHVASRRGMATLRRRSP